MSHFGDYEQDEIADTIISFAKNKDGNWALREKIERIMEAVSYGIATVIYNETEGNNNSIPEESTKGE